MTSKSSAILVESYLMLTRKGQYSEVAIIVSSLSFEVTLPGEREALGVDTYSIERKLIRIKHDKLEWVGARKVYVSDSSVNPHV